MTKRIFSTVIFLFLAILQTSLVSSLPGMLAYLPVIPAASVYLTQHLGIRSAALWLAGFGVFLDFLGIQSYPLETVSYAAAAALTAAAAHHVFSNRSWYGLAACGLLSVSGLFAMRLVFLGYAWLRDPGKTNWSSFAMEFLWNGLLMVVVLSVFFAFAGKIRSFVRHVFFVSDSAGVR